MNIKKFENFFISTKDTQVEEDSTKNIYSSEEDSTENINVDSYENKEIISNLKENHKETQNYMFFANLHNIQRYIDAIKELPEEEVDKMLSEHDWASDHISVACENIEHVHNFLVNSFSEHIPLPTSSDNNTKVNMKGFNEFDQ